MFNRKARKRRDNLAKLAEYLENLPVDYEYFTMSDYVGRRGTMRQLISQEEYLRKNGGIHTCGSVGCAIGHGPSAGILFTDDDFVYSEYLKEYRPDWRNYVQNFVEREFNREFDWMFSMIWARVDNTHRSAAARIRYYLANGVPDNFDDDRVIEDRDWKTEYYGEYIVK